MHQTFFSPNISSWLVFRYQPEQPSVNVQYQIARSQDDAEPDSISESSSNYLTKAQDDCSLSNLLSPKNTEPSRLSGFTVNICTSVIGQTNSRNTDKFRMFKCKAACI